MKNALEFLAELDSPNLKARDRAKALLWWNEQQGSGSPGMTPAEICRIIEDSGHPGQNATRLKSQMAEDKRTFSKVPGNAAWRLHPYIKESLNALYSGTLKAPKKIVSTDSVIPEGLFLSTRSYIEKVVWQINSSYDYGLYDCTAVMCRRLLETLIIEVYEAADRTTDIKGADGNFLMLADLQRTLESDSAFHLGRNAKKGLAGFKRLGDLSAHNRRFNAQRDDVDRVRDDLRVAAEELLHLAKLK